MIASSLRKTNREKEESECGTYFMMILVHDNQHTEKY